MTSQGDLVVYRKSLSEHPGSDRLSKSILKHPDVKNIITKTLLDIDGNAYRIDDVEWEHSLKSNIIYEPILMTLEKPPIIIELQTTVSADYMNRAAHYCIMAYRRYKVLPIMVIFNTQNTSINISDRPRSNNICAMSLACEYWANRCYLINTNSIPSEINSELHPFTALSVFLIKQQTCLLESNLWKDPSIQSLFQIAKDFLEQSIKRKTELLDVIINVCNTGDQHDERIINTSDKTFTRTKKSKKVKRRFEEVDTEEPSNNISTECTDKERYENTMTFVENFKSTCRQMDWRSCYARLQQKTDVIKYKNPEVLRVQYSKFKKK